MMMPFWLPWLKLIIVASGIICIHGDGFKNNVNNPTWGMAGSRLLRLSPAHYTDGAYAMASDNRPNPLDISMSVHMGPSGQASTFGRNALQVFFGQMVMDEMVSVTIPGCPPEYENLDLPQGHPLFNWTSRPQTFIRSTYDQASGYTSNGPRQQLNQMSSFMDGGIIYGNSHVWTNLLRSFKNGQLLADTDENEFNFPAYNNVGLPLVNPPVSKTHQLKSADRLLRIGNPSGHENPFLLALQVIWFRWHNVVAKKIVAEAAPGQLTDWEIFEAARKRVTGHFQNIITNEWLPNFLDGNQTSTSPLSDYEGYDINKHPGVSQEFLVAMSFRHTISPAAVWRLSVNKSTKSCSVNTTDGQNANGNVIDVTSYRLCNNFWDSQELVKSHLDDIVRGLVHTMAEKEDALMVSDITQYFHGPYEYSRKDHAANEIQRFRDHGVAGLNTVLSSVGLPPEDTWDRLGSINGTVHQMYGGDIPDDVDLFTAGLMESMAGKAGMSDVFRKIIVDQFTRARDGDRFWYQNEGMFTSEEIKDIESVTFRQILLETTSLSEEELPQDMFLCYGSQSICSCLNPPNVDDKSNPEVDVCTPLVTHDFFSGSRVSFVVAFTVLGLVAPGAIFVLWLLIRHKKKASTEITRRTSSNYTGRYPNRFKVSEYLGPISEYREVTFDIDSKTKKITIKNNQKKDLRYLDLDESFSWCMANDRGMVLAVLKIPTDIDLILRFTSYEDRERFTGKLKTLSSSLDINMDILFASESDLLKHCLHRDGRQKQLDAFFRIISQQALDGGDRTDTNVEQISEVIGIRLTMTEFAEALDLQPSSLFIKNIFLVADRNNDKRISFHEFLDLFAVFLKGTAREKARLVFNVYDIEGKGVMSEEDFTRMIRSFLEMAETTSAMSNAEVEEMVTSLFRNAGMEAGGHMNFEQFQEFFCSGSYASVLEDSTFAGQVTKHAPKPKPKPQPTTLANTPRRRNIRNTFIQSYRARPGRINKENESTPPSSKAKQTKVKVTTHKTNYPMSKLQQRWHSISRFLERYRWQTFWVTLYTLVTIGIFVERSYLYAVGREHTGLRRVSGAWVVASIRGSASVIMFTFASLLLTMCRNLITALRETFLHRFVPFDSAVAFHKYIAVLAMIGIVIHIVGHAINLYSMSTQSSASLNCFFREYYTDSNSLTHFHYWIFQTITGLAGVAVTILIFIMYVFASQYSRRHVFKAFWMTHSLYWLVYVLTFLHGVGRLVQAPLFPLYLIGPLTLFILDRLKSISRKKVEITVKSSTALPSGVTRLIFRRPESFTYRSGQWVRIACLSLSKSEYHPFTLTSAPHESTLSLHIRAVGPWTKALRKIYTRDSDLEEPLPNLYIDGPFGEGHQDWYTTEVAVLVGGGIGVTPFASILKDIAFKSKTGISVACKRVYFLWVTRTQKGFEWMVDIIREAETADTMGIVKTHVFITQFPQKYDLRTTMLYICERHFQKLEGKSIFTGLKSVTHFGRPNFDDLFTTISQEFQEVSQIGVFSCGPGPMTSTVQAACSRMNSHEGPTFSHHFENF